MANVQTYSHNLTILDYYRRPDGCVVIRFVIYNPGIYYNLRFASRAFQAGDVVGIPMTPALGDSQHVQDPVIVTTPGQTFTWVWNAPSDGFANINLGGWTIFLGYLNLFCCESDEPDPRPVEPDPPAGPPAPPLPPLPPLPPPPILPTPTTPVTPPPIFPAAPWTNDTGGVLGSVPYYQPIGASYAAAPATIPDNEPLIIPGQYSGAKNAGYVSGAQINMLANGSFSVGDAIFNRIGDSYYDPYGNLVYTVPTAPAVSTYQTPTPGLAPVAGGAVNFSDPLAVTPSTTQGGKLTESSQFGATANLQAANPSTVSASIYTLPQTNGQLTIAAEMYPSTSPQDVGATIFVAVNNLGDAYSPDLSVYVEALDSEGQRLALSSSNPIPAIPPQGGGGVTICTAWISLVVGPITIAVTLMGPGGTPIVGLTMPGVVTPPGTMPAAPTAIVELPHNVRDAAWGTGAPDIHPLFEGSFNAIGNEDCYLIDVVSDRVGIVVKITADAKLSGFLPVLKIYSTSDLSTPIVSTSGKFDVQNADQAEYAVGWRDFAQLPLLTKGSRYILQVVHQYPFYSRRWGFKIYTKETSPAVVTTLSIDGTLKLTGSIFAPYGRQSIKLINDRTHDTLFVKLDASGNAASIQSAASPAGDKLTVAAGDVLRLYRPGMAVAYKSTDLIYTTHV